MKRSIKFLSLVFLLALTFSLLRASTARAALTVTDGMAASLVLGQANFTSNTAATTQTGMNSPRYGAVDPTTGKVFVADVGNHRVLRFASVSSLTNGAAAEAVLGQPNFTSSACPAPQANSMCEPHGLFVDSGGRLWVADKNNNRVLRFDSASSKTNGANADGVLGQANFTSNGNATTQSGMWNPFDVSVDSAGRLWVAEYSNSRVTRFDNAASLANGANANGVLGESNFTSLTFPSPPTASSLWLPTALYADSSGRLWVTDHNVPRVLRFDNAASKADGGAADGVLGQVDFVSTGSGLTQNTFSSARGLTYDNINNRLFVMDRENNRVMVFNSASTKANGANADNVLGQTNFTSNGAGTTSTTLNNPWNGFFDPAAEILWVVDGGNHRVLKYETFPLIVTTTTDVVDANGGICTGITTSNIPGPDGLLSLREAICAVNNTAGADTITFASSLNGTPIQLTIVGFNENNNATGDLDVTDSLTITGNGSANTVIQGNFASQADRIFQLSSGITVKIEKLAITGGVASTAGSGSWGGGILNSSSLTLNEVYVYGNTASTRGGGLNFSDGTSTINKSTVYNNTSGTSGAGIFVGRDSATTNVTLTNSTLSGNNAGGSGGGLAVYQFAGGGTTANLIHATVANNVANNNNDGSSGGGVSNIPGVSGTLNIQNTIVADNTVSFGGSGTNCSGTLTTAGYNVTKTSCGLAGTGDTVADPGLGTLTNNGGPTTTHAITSSSPAANIIPYNTNGCGTTYTTDQRSFPRPFSFNCDSGAFEVTYTISPGVNGGDGPGGVGVTDGSSTLELWLDGDSDVYSDGGCTTPSTNSGSVSCWQDQSGNNAHAIAGVSPTYHTSIINNMPVLRFIGSSRYLNNSTLTLGSNISIFSVAVPSANTGTYQRIIDNELNFFMGTDPAQQYATFYGNGSGWGTTASHGIGLTNGVSYILESVNNGTDSPYLNGGSLTPRVNPMTGFNDGFRVGERSDIADQRWNGDIAEIVIFSVAFNNTERILVENYLSSKYAIALSGNDVYDGDTGGNGNFDLDVAGIGRFGGNNHTQANAAGMIILNKTFLQDNGDWLLFGHRTPVNSNVTTDLPTGAPWDTAPNPVRWDRHFYIDVTDAAGTTGGKVDIIFDFSEGGMGGLNPDAPASNYRLLKRTGTSGNFSDITVASGANVVISGDQVQFIGVDVSQLGSNFTLGSLDGVDSPTAITLQTLTAQGAVVPLILTVFTLMSAVLLLLIWRKRNA